MVLTCPSCGSRNIRYSYSFTPAEKVATLMGIRPIRCRDCRERFTHRAWKFSDLIQARCPKCMRINLTRWSPHHSHVSLRHGLLLLFGAKPYRCEHCRLNFVSFRRRRKRRVEGREREDVVAG